MAVDLVLDYAFVDGTDNALQEMPSSNTFLTADERVAQLTRFQKCPDDGALACGLRAVDYDRRRCGLSRLCWSIKIQFRKGEATHRYQSR